MIISYKPAAPKNQDIVRKRRAHPEEDQQVAFVQFLEIEKRLGRVILFSASAASTPAGKKDEDGKWRAYRGAIQRNARMGVRPGVPDLEILAKSSAGTVVSIRIELKSPASNMGDVREEQKEWLRVLNMAGQYACVAFSCAEAIEKYKLALNMRRTAFIACALSKYVKKP